MSGKMLTDEGLAHFIGDLLECVKFRCPEHPDGVARLTELHLSNNQLSVVSLAQLAGVVVLSAGDLRELDLSHNLIEVKTEDQKHMWQKFLEAFKDCYMLKKIDFSNNPLGRNGTEILARVYMQTELDFTEADADEVVFGSNAGRLAAASKQSSEVLFLKTGNEVAGAEEGKKDVKKSPGKAKLARSISKSETIFITKIRFVLTRSRKCPIECFSDQSFHSSRVETLCLYSWFGIRPVHRPFGHVAHQWMRYPPVQHGESP